MPANIRLYGTTGYVELAAPATGNNATLTLPTDSIQPGMVLVASQSFSAVSSVSVNNCFTNAYDHYQIAWTVTCTSLVSQYMRLRSGGTDNSTASSYLIDAFGRVNNGVDGGELTSDAWDIGAISNTSVYVPANRMDIFGPNKAVSTSFLQHHINFQGSYIRQNMIAGFHTQQTAYDGFTMYVASGTMTGSLRVYGYRS